MTTPSRICIHSLRRLTSIIIFGFLLSHAALFAAPPFSATQPATQVTPNSAVLGGMAVPNGLPASAWFERGTNGSYSQATSPVLVGAGTTVVRVTSPINGLTPGGTWQFRLVVSNSAGVAYGAVHLLTTGKKVVLAGGNQSVDGPPMGVTNAVAVAAGRDHCLVLRPDGTVAAWGDNAYNQTNVPAGLNNVVAIAAGGSQSLALRSDGSVANWGSAWPAAENNFVAIACGGYHSAGLRADGTVAAWGWNDRNQLNVPAGLSNVVAIACGSAHSIALKADGTVTGWGFNSYGQADARLFYTNAVAVAASGDFSMALLANGSIQSWGGGMDLVPGDLGDVVQAAAGAHHCVAVKADGTVRSWGNLSQSWLLTNFVSCAAASAGDDYCLAIGDQRPAVLRLTRSGHADRDLLVWLQGSDPDGDPLSFRIATLPTKGALYQYMNGGRGALIASPNTAVSDPFGLVYFVPAAGESGDPYAAFSYVANDGEADSLPAAVTISVAGSFAFTQSATQIQSDSAKLNGMALPSGLNSVAWFEWGTNGGYGQLTAPAPVGAGTTVTQTTARITGLVPGGVYQGRIVVSNSAGVAHGAAQRFTTGQRVFTWGNGILGQTNLCAGLSNTVAIGAGSVHGLALKADGTVRVWGNNNYSQTNVPIGLNGVVGISAGYWNNLALKSNGTVVAWGAGTSDTGISQNFGQSIVPWYLSNVVAVAAGGTHGLALRSDGTVVGWGSTNSGQAVVPPGLANVAAIAAGGSHSLALRIDGTVVGWGRYYSGQTNVPTGLNNVIAIAARGDVSLALTADGRVVAWGDNAYGQTNVPSDLGAVVGITTSGSRCAAVRADGTMLAWGDNSYDQTNAPLGTTGILAAAEGSSHTILLGPNFGPQASPQTALVFANYDSVVRLTGTDPNLDDIGFQIASVPTVGRLYQYAGGGRGSLLSAGMSLSDPFGRLIFSPETNSFGLDYSTFTFRANDGEFYSGPATVTVDIAVAAAFTQPAIAIGTNAATLTGYAAPNGYPGLAWFEWGPDGALGEVTTPAAHPGGSIAWLTNRVTGLLPGRVYQCRLVVSNATRLAYGPVQRFVTGRKPTAWGLGSSGQLSVPSTLSNAVSLAGGNNYSLALKTDGKVVAWGDNTYGQTTVPVSVSNIVAISAGGGHNLALRADGKPLAWGRNTSGQATVPAWLSNATSVAAGSLHSLALRSDGTVVAWGSNAYGQTNVPLDLANIVAISAGYQHCLALTSFGRVVAWGYPDNRVNVPSDLRDVVAIAAGEMHNVALKSDGTVVAWGTNALGQVNVPASLSNVVAIAAGYDHSLALKANGAVMGWGSNAAGQTNIQPIWTNIAVIAAGGDHSLAIGNRIPNASSQSIYANANHDRLTTLFAADLDNDPLTCRILSLPTAGALYQYAPNGRGPAILAVDTLVTDASRRVYFAPPADNFSVFPSFKFRVNDGLADSMEATIGITIFPPPEPTITAISSGANNSFLVSFTGDSNTSHCVWISTNLVTWQYSGQATQTAPGEFNFVDFYATNCPQRFYRVQAACRPPGG